MAVLPIVKYPETVLARPTRRVETIDDDVRKLVADMIETMYAAPGVGLAANQVGVDLRITVIDLTVGEQPGELRVLINPEILEFDGEQVGEEGCLSLPGFMESHVRRPDRAVARALDLDGKEYTIEGEGLMARALMHETDHLDGKLFISHLSPLKRDTIKRKVRKLIRSGEWDEMEG